MSVAQASEIRVEVSLEDMYVFAVLPNPSVEPRDKVLHFSHKAQVSGEGVSRSDLPELFQYTLGILDHLHGMSNITRLVQGNMVMLPFDQHGQTGQLVQLLSFAANGAVEGIQPE